MYIYGLGFVSFRVGTHTPNSKNVGPPSNIHFRGRGNVYIEGVWGVLRRGGFPTWD